MTGNTQPTGISAKSHSPGALSGPAASTPRDSHRASELTLVLCFLALIAAVPVAQTCLELACGKRVQFTDVFRARPTAKNLRQYEAALKENSWVYQRLRPEVQRLFFAMFRDTGPNGLLGRDQWLFYRPDLRYLVEPDRTDTKTVGSRWVNPSDGATARNNVARAIVRFRDQLKERGVTLVVLPVPGKPAVYPEQAARRATDQVSVRSPTSELIAMLNREGVSTIDLFALFAQERTNHASVNTGNSLYLARDTHWTPHGARLAAEHVAARLQQWGLAPAPTKQFKSQTINVARWGDILEMTHIPGLRDFFAPEFVQCEQVIDPALGPLVPTPSDRPGAYRHPAQNASVLVLGDSFCRIYQFPEPQSLGEVPDPSALTAHLPDHGSKRFLPGSAGFVSHLAAALASPVDCICSDGGAATDVRRKLSTDPEILEAKKVVIWEFVERDIALGSQGWEDVPLPHKLD